MRLAGWGLVIAVPLAGLVGLGSEAVYMDSGAGQTAAISATVVAVLAGAVAGVLMVATPDEGSLEREVAP